jgi:hypothetical protein
VAVAGVSDDGPPIVTEAVSVLPLELPFDDAFVHSHLLSLWNEALAIKLAPVLIERSTS